MKVIKITPEPFNKYVKVRSNIESDYTITLRTLKGKMVFLHTYPGSNHDINLNHLPAGPYKINVVCNGRILVNKFIELNQQK